MKTWIKWALVAVVVGALIMWRKKISEWAGSAYMWIVARWNMMSSPASKTIETDKGIQVITPEILGTPDNMQSVPGVATKK